MKNTKEYFRQENVKNSNGTAVIKSKFDAVLNLRDLLVAGLMDMYWSEKELTKVIPNMVKNATSGDLADDLEVHLEETLEQVTRLEEVFALLHEKPIARKCVAMEGLINEALLIMKETEQGAVRDAGIIAAAQKIEHYEIASYGTLATFAKTLGEIESSFILEEILAEEKESDEALSKLAVVSINEEANHMEEDDSEQEMEESDQEEDPDEDDEMGEDFPIRRIRSSEF